MPIQNRLDELFLRFTDSQWGDLSAEQRMQTLQEVEIIIAQEQGRKPRKVMLFELNEENEHSCGYYSSRDDVIYLNPKYLRAGVSIPGLSGYTAMDALDTVLHEGRHAWQHDVADSNDDRVDPRLRALLKMNFANYCGPVVNKNVYNCQPVELDARRFARERFAQLARRAIDNGCEDLSIIRQMHYTAAIEYRNAVEARRVLTAEDLLRYEAETLDRLRRREPDFDTAGVSMFGETIAMLGDDDAFDEYIDGKPLNWRDETVGSIAVAMDRADAAPDDGLDPELRSLLERIKAAPVAVDRGFDRPDDLRLR